MNGYRWLLIVGMPRSGTSYLAGQIHAAGMPMWLELPGTVHLECPRMIEAMNKLDRGDPSGLIGWREQACGLDTWPVGAKQPRLIRYPADVLRVFPPEESRYIICRRDVLAACRSMDRLTDWSMAKSLWDYSIDVGMLPAWWAVRQSVFWFNYDGDIGLQEGLLSEFLGRPVDLATDWRYSAWPTDAS